MALFCKCNLKKKKKGISKGIGIEKIFLLFIVNTLYSLYLLGENAKIYNKFYSIGAPAVRIFHFSGSLKIQDI